VSGESDSRQSDRLKCGGAHPDLLSASHIRFSAGRPQLQLHRARRHPLPFRPGPVRLQRETQFAAVRPYNIDSTRLFSPYGLFASNAMHDVANSEQSHIIRVMNLSANWIASPGVVNQITSAFFHTSLAISTGPNAARARAPNLSIPRVFEGVTDSGGL